ncbi:hypothetical protein [Chondromyces apiculatus]|uniref:Uncharacterized protein n=1 Tax=Chondromyces apiculatus DSM 436 TaxID=1192034 RepID=A0A017SXA8_9BACT|nr:hypothetical protein [Chondromyces apiculatus]EYF00951.1 Hypothetical protein CAP_8819 [Chondromyces apiculatus DSM 436]
MHSGLSLFLLASADGSTPCSCQGMAFLGFSASSLLFLAFVIWLAVKLLRKLRRKGKPGKRQRTDLDRWVDDMLAREVHKKLGKNGIDRDTVQRALEGTPEPEAVSAIEDAVKSIQMRYAKTPREEYEARLEVSFEDGTTATATRLLTAAQLPPEVWEELGRTGGSYVFRTVHFSWSEPERWS